LESAIWGLPVRKTLSGWSYNLKNSLNKYFEELSQSWALPKMVEKLSLRN
jgi:hypothetical protein